MEIFLKYSIGILIYLYRWPQGITWKIHNFTMQQNISWSAFVFSSPLLILFFLMFESTQFFSQLPVLLLVCYRRQNHVTQCCKNLHMEVWKFSEKALENKVELQLCLFGGTRGVLQFWNTSVFIYTLLCSTHINACGIK